MKENISVEAGKCCTHWLKSTFHSVICHVLLHLRGEFLCTEESHVKGG